MAPKKASTAAPKKAAAPAAAPAHSTYKDMIKQAIVSLKEVRGSSRQAIVNYIKGNNKLTGTDAAIKSHINTAIKAGEKTGDFLRPKGPSGTVKLAKKEKGDAPKTTAAKPAKKPATTTSATAAKKPATKKEPAPATKKTAAATTKKTGTAATKAAPATTKTKANVAKARKPAAKKTATATSANAVEDKAPVELTKTKSGRVSKGQPTAATKKAAPKKTTTKKAAAPKKTATPKKTSASPKKATPAA